MVTLPPDKLHHSNLPEERGELQERKDGVGQGMELQPLDQKAQGGGLHRMKALYNLEEGWVGCRCILRRWKFCQHIKGQAGGAKLNFKLLRAHTLKEVQEMEKSNLRQGGGPLGTPGDLLDLGEEGEAGDVLTAITSESNKVITSDKPTSTTPISGAGPGNSPNPTIPAAKLGGGGPWSSCNANVQPHHPRD